MKPGPALRRPAAARGHRPRDHQGAEGAADGRAAVAPWTPGCARRCAPRSCACTASISSTIIYVTHDQVEAMTMSTRVAVMDAGPGAADRRRRGRSSAGPRTSTVATFIGTPAMNIVPAAVVTTPARTGHRAARAADPGGTAPPRGLAGAEAGGGGDPAAGAATGAARAGADPRARVPARAAGARG